MTDKFANHSRFIVMGTETFPVLAEKIENNREMVQLPHGWVDVTGKDVTFVNFRQPPVAQQ